MNLRRNATRRVEEVAARRNQAPPQAALARSQVPVHPAILINREVKEALIQMAQAITTQALSDFIRMNPPFYYGPKTNEDPMEFVDEVYKILYAMGVDEEAKDEFTSYSLKDVAHVWYKMWADGREPGDVPITWDNLKTAFLERFFPKNQ
ncbi:hypothetical protein EJD97_016271 [Solanum chilense]|uniref:Retrotransposon gag domain-containing protein n=1 Tax=Solanum chilense TaxID=4083 RepID=A0A6N2B7R9_SOLCI|nr:hypothetical protein EJD97_016271 [Solanum chilense]